MRFLSKIRERQFAKKWGGAYNLSKAVLAGVLAAGCLMPGFAEAAPAPALVTKLDHYITDNDNLITVDRTEGENTATITAVNGNVGDKIDISWMPGAGETSVEGCTINVNSITIEPEIHIYGGEGTTAAKGNSVSISGGTFKNIVGGYASSGTAEGNSVEINGGTFNANVYGGQGTTAANRNSVIINAGTINSLICGGDGYTAEGNSVEINGGTINAEVSGGFSQYGKANNNKVSISGGEFYYNVYGGYGATAANGNSVEINGGTIKKNVFGGYSNSGNANKNSVSISGGTLNGDVRVWGGWADSNSGNADGNSVSISGGTFNDSVRVWGGLSQSGTANKNSVIISGGKFYNDFYGGKGETAADENRVIISGGKFSRCWVYGGYSLNGTANRNQVIISDGTFDGNVVGGSSTKEAKDNKIVLLGNNANYTFTNAHVR